MKKIFTTLLIINTAFQAAFSQFNRADIKYDSTSMMRNSAGTIYQANYYRHHELVMQKFYPNGSSIGGFCNGSNLVYDSVLVHLGASNYIANFEMGGGAINVYSWLTNSNLLTTSSYTLKGALIGSIEEVKTADASSAFVPCWYLGYRTGKEYRPLPAAAGAAKKAPQTAAVPVLDTALLLLKQKAIALLQQHYGREFTTKHLVFNPAKSSFYKQEKSSYYQREEPEPGSGFMLNQFQRADSLFRFADIAFDIQIDAYRYPVISLRLSRQGKLVTKTFKSWRSLQCVSSGLLAKKAEAIISPARAKQIAAAHSKWPLVGNTVVNLVWQARAEGDSLGSLLYEVSYDFLNRSYDASFARQVVLDAVQGTFINEKEASSQTASVQGSRKFSEGSKWGFTDWGATVIPAQYNELPEYYSAFMVANKDGSYGIINGKNEVLLPFEYDKIEYFHSSLDRYNYWYLLITKGGKTGLYQRNKGLIFDANYVKLSENKLEQLVAEKPDGKREVYDLRKEQMEHPKL